MRKKTYEEYVGEVAAINPNIEVIGEYIGANVKTLHCCKLCCNKWMARPNHILQGRGCPECALLIISNKTKKSHEQYVKEVAQINPNIEVIGMYNGALTKIAHRCKIDGCGYKWEAYPTHILNNSGCPICGIKKIGDKLRKTHEEYVSEVFSFNPNIEVLGIYANNNVKILHRCKIDDYKWYATPSNILQGQCCPKCNYSNGESAIANWLNKNNIAHKPQETFENCKDKYVLRFDFYLPDYNICIEYNGKQHYEPVDYFGGKDAFEYIVKHDKIKEDYCKENNILLITIPYFADVYEELEKMYELIIGGDCGNESI